MNSSETVFIKTKVENNRVSFEKVSAKDTIIILPQCLRNTLKCSAKDLGWEYRCSRCGNCQIDRIIEIAEKNSYEGVFTLKGGSSIKRVITEKNPCAILGVACMEEGYLGLKYFSNTDICTEFVPLNTDGCADTTVLLTNIENMLIKKET